MPDPAWPSSPPEVNYLKLAGSTAAGTATTLAGAAAWQALMASNELAFSLSAMNTAATAADFEGLGGAGSAAAATGLNSALQLLAGWVQEKPPIATSAVAAYEAALSSMIPAEVSLANRAEQAADVAINPLVFGALTPAIAALDTAYFGEYWPHNAGAGAAYGSALAALVPALAVPPPLAPPGASPAAPAAAVAAATEVAGQATAATATGESGQAQALAGEGVPAEAAGQFAHVATGMMQPLTGMFQAPMQASQSLASLSQSLLGPLGDMAGAGFGEAALPAAMPAAGGAVAPGFAGGTGSGPAVPCGSTAGAGGSAGTGGVPSPGLTSFTRPTSSFAPEISGRPVSLTSGLLGGPELRGPTAPVGGTAVPVSPAQAGMPRRGKGDPTNQPAPRARIVAAGDRTSAPVDS